MECFYRWGRPTKKKNKKNRCGWTKPDDCLHGDYEFIAMEYWTTLAMEHWITQTESRHNHGLMPIGYNCEYSRFPVFHLVCWSRTHVNTCVCVWSVLIRVTGRWCTSVDQATQLPENWNNCWERAGKDSSKWDSKRGTMYGPKCLVSCHELAHMRWWWSWGGWAERQSWKEQQSCGAAPMGISNTRAEVADGGGRSSAHPWIATRRRDFSSKVLLKLKCPKDICSSAENARTSCGISMISPLVVSPSVSCRCTLLWFCDRTASWDVNGRQEVSTKCSIPTKKTNQVWKTKVGRCQCRQAINVNWRPTRVIASCDVSMKLLILFCTCEDQSGQLT